MKKNGPWTIQSSEIKYENPWIEVREDKVKTEDGKDGLFGIVDYGKGVSVVALDKNQNACLIREYYYALEEYGIQLPSGDIATGETPLDGAKRELLEEVGAAARTWVDLGYINPFTMIIKSPAYLFLAQDTEITQEPESGIERVVVPFDEAVGMVLESRITHGPSCIALLKAKQILDRKGV